MPVAPARGSVAPHAGAGYLRPRSTSRGAGVFDHRRGSAAAHGSSEGVGAKRPAPYREPASPRLPKSPRK